MTYVDKYGDEWPDKKSANKYYKYSKAMKKPSEYGYRRSKWLSGSRTNIRSFGISNHVKQENCPKCGRLAPMTTDYYGDVMCGTCLRNSIV